MFYSLSLAYGTQKRARTRNSASEGHVCNIKYGNNMRNNIGCQYGVSGNFSGDFHVPIIMIPCGNNMRITLVVSQKWAGMSQVIFMLLSVSI